MDRKQVGRLMLMCLAAGAAMLAMPSAAFAQEATRAAERATFLTTLFISMSVVFHRDDSHAEHGHHTEAAAH